MWTPLGKPDLGFTSLTEVTTACQNINSAISIPLIADADTGYGNAVNVMYTIQRFIQARAAGVHIEDQEFPKRWGHVSGKKVISTTEMVGKIRAAVRVREELEPDFAIIARSDVHGTSGGSFDKLLDWCKAYIDAGADVIFPEALPNEDELEKLATLLPVPIHYQHCVCTPHGSAIQQ